MTEAAAFGAWRAQRGARGGVVFSRAHPLDVGAALIGAPAASAPSIAKALHALCPMAHAIATRRALEAARGRPAPAGLEAARTIALEAEAAAAAAFRFGALWAAALGLKPDPAAGEARRAAQALIRAAFAGVLEDRAGPALAAALRAVMRGASVAAAMAAAEGLKAVPDPARPGDMLFDRLTALLIDSEVRAEACERLAGPGRSTPPEPAPPFRGSGRGAAAALRGPVFVSIAVEAGVIREAQISAPTDRLLASGGPLARALESVTPSLAPLAILAFDPCAPVLCALEPAIVGEEPAHA